MITRIELDGIKTFEDFSLDLGPFQVIVGVNGAGKSNMFDALHLLSRLVDDDLRTAFGALRGEAGELFTVRPDGSQSKHMRLAVDLFVERRVEDSWGATADITYTRLRYELQIGVRPDDHGLVRLYVTHESLKPIPRSEDAWSKRYIGANVELWHQPLKAERGVAFISTTGEGAATSISLRQDGHGGRKVSRADRIERTVLSGVTNTEFPHAFAARQEMRSWAFLHLNPEVLREPSPMLAQPRIAADGGHLPNALARMRREDPLLLNDVARDLGNLVTGIIAVTVDDDPLRHRYTIWAHTQDGRQFSSRVLSDGTLRLLALATLRNDPEHRGVVCLEEPENGLHPSRLRNLAQLLRGLATDFADREQRNEPLRQMLVNTHSPVLISQPEMLKHVVFAQMVTRLVPSHGRAPARVTHMLPVPVSSQPPLGFDQDSPELHYTLDQVVQYLQNSDHGEALVELQRVVGG